MNNKGVNLEGWTKDWQELLSVKEQLTAANARIRELEAELATREDNMSELIVDESMGIYESIEWGDDGWVLNQIVRPGKYQDCHLGRVVRYTCPELWEEPGEEEP